MRIELSKAQWEKLIKALDYAFECAECEVESEERPNAAPEDQPQEYRQAKARAKKFMDLRELLVRKVTGWPSE